MTQPANSQPTPPTADAVSRVQRAEAAKSGGTTAAGGHAAKLQSAYARQGHRGGRR